MRIGQDLNLDVARTLEISLDVYCVVAKRGLVKVLGRGEISVPLTVKAHAFSDAARRAIEAAGGSVEVLPAPWGDRRPAARGNALTNR